MKSMCHDVRRNSPSVALRRPMSRWTATTSRMASSSMSRRPSGLSCPAARSARAWSRCGGRRRLPTWSARNGGVVRSVMAATLERVRGNVAPDGDPTLVGEGIEVGLAAEARAGARGQYPAERSDRLVVDGLVVDVDDAGRDLVGQGE